MTGADNLMYMYFNFEVGLKCDFRFKMLEDTAQRQPTDGINSIVYSLHSAINLPLYTRINVKVNQTDVMNASPRDSLPSFLTGISNS